MSTDREGQTEAVHALLGRAIRDIRLLIDPDKSMAAASRECQVSETYLSLIETGKRSFSLRTIETVACGLGIPTAWLLAWASSLAEDETTKTALDVVCKAIKHKLKPPPNFNALTSDAALHPIRTRP